MRQIILAITLSCLIRIPDCFCQAGLALKTARTVSFDTDEGTNMDVAISPDGKTLVFNLLGDLYTLPSTGGEAKQITRGLALHIRPFWSTDSKKIICISDYTGSWHLNLIDQFTGAHRLIGDPNNDIRSDANPIWSPDGNYIIVKDIAYGLSGSKVSTDFHFRYFLCFSPDGRFAYGIDSSRLYSYNIQTKKKYRLNSDTLIKNVDFIMDAHPLLSPDTHWFTYTENTNGKRHLMLRDLRSGEKHVLISSVFEKTSLYKDDLDMPSYSFSSDSKHLFIGYGGKIHKIELETGYDRVIPFHAHVKADLAALHYHTFRVNDGPVSVRYARNASVSPDSKRLVFAALNKVYVKDLPKGNPHLLANQPFNQFQPIFSADSKWITYIAWQDTSGGSVWRVPVTGGKPQCLMSSVDMYLYPTWSPDGRKLAFITGNFDPANEALTGNGQLWVKDMQINSQQLIDPSVPLSNRLSFSDDGKIIRYQPVYKEDRKTGLGPQLVSKILTEGSRDTLVTGFYTTGNYAKQKVLSPDGKYLVYSRAEDLFLLPVYQGNAAMVSGSDLYNNKAQKIAPIRFASGLDPYWEKGGHFICWTYGHKFYRLRTDRIISAAQTAVVNQKDIWSKDDDFVTVNIGPDETIDLKASVPSQVGHGMIALKNVRIITMQSTKVIEKGTIIIKDGRIQSVGAASSAIIPDAAQIYDLRGKTVMPGLIDLHFHLHLTGGLFPQQPWQLLAGLAYGVTTARDPSAFIDQFGYMELLQAGKMIGPRLFTVGVKVNYGSGTVRLDDLNDARNVIKKRVLYGALAAKNYLDDNPRLKRQWVEQASNEYGLNVTNEGARDIPGAVAMLKDGSAGVEHSPAWTDAYNDVVRFFAASGTWLTPTFQVGLGNIPAKEYFNYQYWHEPDAKLRRFMLSDSTQRVDAFGASIQTILHAKPVNQNELLHPSFIYSSGIYAAIRHQGGHVTVGSHGNDVGIGTHNELWALQAGGLTNLEALQAATIMGAEGLGVQHDLGSLAPGKIADLLILNKNPLEDIHNTREIKYVMKDGILYDGDTLDELWPLRTNLPEWKLKK